MARLKSEFLQHYYDANGISFRSRLIANITRINRLGSSAPALYNFFQRNRLISAITKRSLGFAPKRNIPLLCSTTLRAWAAQNPATGEHHGRTVYLFADEFSDFNDVGIGIKAIKLLNALGWRVIIPGHAESGRTFLSKGLVRKAKKLAMENVIRLKELITEDTPLVGLEPSAILTFRDEYPDLVDAYLKEDARKLAENALLFDEFILKYILGSLAEGALPDGRHLAELFTGKPARIRLHGHCHQKALASVEPTLKMLSIPANYRVEEIRSGCCGMAGSFGYEKEHYEVSMKIGELVLFPEIRKTGNEVIIAAPGTSCRQQILDGTGRRALHPVEVLYDALLR